MKKKWLSILLCGAMVAVVATGCASKTSSQKPGDKPSAEISDVKAVDQKKVFVPANWVKSVIDGKQKESENYIIIEAAWGKAEEDKAYTKAHISGAVHLNTDEIEEDKYWDIRTGEEIAKVMKTYGVTKDTNVIIYGGDSGATRVAFVFLWAGVENVKVLDGGLDAWTKAGYATKDGIETAKATTKDFGLKIPAHPEYVLSIDEVKDKLANNKNFRLVSVRSIDEFEGKKSGYSYIKRAGEPKGAVWGHDEADYRNEDGTFINFDKAAAMWAEQGITKNNDIAFYCGTGWRATIPWLMAYQNGWANVKLYDGGWFVWQMDEKNPVQAITPQEAAAKYK